MKNKFTIDLPQNFIDEFEKMMERRGITDINIEKNDLKEYIENMLEGWAQGIKETEEFLKRYEN